MDKLECPGDYAIKTGRTMATEILREIIPLTKNDCFTVFSRSKTGFDFPLHTHDELELNLILNAKGAKRIIGDHIDEIDKQELVLVGPNLQHGWFNYHNNGSEIREITIQFHKDLFDEHFLQRNQMNFIRTLFEKSCQGVLFSAETTLRSVRGWKDYQKKKDLIQYWNFYRCCMNFPFHQIKKSYPDLPSHLREKAFPIIAVVLKQ